MTSDERFATELLPLVVDTLNGCKLFQESLVPIFGATGLTDTKAEATIMLYRAIELQKALAIFIERVAREGVTHRLGV